MVQLRYVVKNVYEAQSKYTVISETHNLNICPSQTFETWQRKKTLDLNSFFFFNFFYIYINIMQNSKSGAKEQSE